MYFQIGLVTLLGLAAKNAILIVEFAIYKHQEGMSAAAAAIEAARLRFRPILMTSLAFILGVLPLAISHGAGAGARQAVGTGVMGGMLAATFLAIFFVPLFYRLITERRLREARSTDELFAEVRATHAKARRPRLGQNVGLKNACQNLVASLPVPAASSQGWPGKSMKVRMPLMMNRVKNEVNA